MSQASKSQASRSHPEDSRREHSKASQKPSPANASVRDNIDIDEAKGGVKKVVATPAHVGPHNEHGQERDSLNERQINRVSRPVPQDAKEVPGGARKARRYSGTADKPLRNLSFGEGRDDT
jgi:hypothetical protein